MHDLEILLLCGSYKIMQDLLCIFQEISCISMHDLEILLLCGSYKIMQDLLCIFLRNILYFNAWSWNNTVVWILQDYARSLVHLSKKNLGISMHILETLLLCGSYKIMQDLLCIFLRNIMYFNARTKKQYCCVDLTRLCKISCAIFPRKFLDFQS